MTKNFDLRPRLLVPIVMLAAAGLAVGFFTLMRSPGAEPSASPSPTTQQALSPTRRGGHALEQPAAPTPKTAPRVAPRPKPATRNGLPARIASALGRNRVVVVSVMSPEASIDDVSLREARAGAQQSGVGFVAISALDQSEMRPLAARLGVRHTPAVLVFKRPGRLFVQIDGFADRETVAQAAANASS